ncbi:rhodanese-like domain-containing protein [Treponema brennaborense]|uniref:Rhodanese-like protein n=1 Tax=Treponema brennaborense (strain DSM 12168 / CIP 105900 / DD5/3) TaxID=906968 RepID=F4LNI2_TREBD|nr:rhodanese-like domain-containing protein [Treponema brennaborense]AEE15836.1 Rhodanese-like protein [Treponema brennaborense DSM 12168]
MKYLLAAAVLTLAVFAASAQTEKGTGGYRKIGAEQAKTMMDSGTPIIVDVRTPAEYEAGHVPGAILLPNETVADKKPAVLNDTNATVLVYCRSGRRSAEAARKLIKLGYTNVYDFGGIIDWPYETVTGKE